MRVIAQWHHRASGRRIVNWIVATFIVLLMGNGFTAPQPWVQHGDSTPDMMRYEDVNGDGRAEALYFDTLRSRQVWVQLSTY